MRKHVYKWSRCSKAVRTRDEVFTDEEGQIIGDAEVGRVVRQSVIDDRVRHPVERQDEELLPDVRISDQIHRRGRGWRRSVLVLAIGFPRSVPRIRPVARYPLPPQYLHLRN